MRLEVATSDSLGVYLIGEITLEMTERILRETHSDSRPQKMYLSTPGGDVGCALAIYDALRQHGHVTVIATGNVSSAGVIVLLGGTERKATPHARFLFHELSLEGESTPYEQAELLASTELVAQLYSERMTLTPAASAALLQGETRMDVEQARRLGLLTM
jgi:ATP-dependent protease ClpP protease subunit